MNVMSTAQTKANISFPYREVETLRFSWAFVGRNKHLIQDFKSGFLHVDAFRVTWVLPN